MAIFCGRQFNYVSIVRGENKAAYIILLALVVISENPENFRCGLECDDRLEEKVGSRS